MLEEIQKMRRQWAEGDAIRDAGLTVPEGLQRFCDISYGDDPLQVLDVYLPEGSKTPLPTIISIHGGGWFYGDKELYSHYCMGLATRGFAVVNFSYRLAPEHKYPAPLEDCCSVLSWVQQHGAQYHIDLNNLFLVGDSAGGQLCCQLGILLSNPGYAALFSFRPPEGIRINACALNCGCYFIPLSRFISPKRMGILLEAYFPEDYLPLVPQLRIRKYLTRDFPPAFVMTAKNDYLRFMARPMDRLLKCRGVESVLRIYGTRKQKDIGHVFHLNCRSQLARQCNDQQCDFFRQHLK